MYKRQSPRPPPFTPTPRSIKPAARPESEAAKKNQYGPAMPVWCNADATIGVAISPGVYICLFFSQEC